MTLHSTAFRQPRLLRAAIALGAASVVSCKSLDRFDTKDSGAFCGSLAAAPAFQDGFLPTAARPTLNLRLQLDMNALIQRADQVAIVGHFVSDDASRGLCAPVALFEGAPLRTVPKLDNDPLSLLEFGEGRDYNFFAWVDSSCQGTMLSVVSLMRNDDVEVRLFKPAALAAQGAGPAEQAGFGLFHLTRQIDGCEF